MNDNTQPIEEKEQSTDVNIPLSKKEFNSLLEDNMIKIDEKIKSLQKNFKISSEDKKEKIKEQENKLKTTDFLRGAVNKDFSKLSAHSSERAKALNEATGSDGGYLVPEEFESGVIRFTNQFNILRSRATVVTMGTDTLRLNELTGEPTVYIVGEQEAITASQPTFGEEVLTPVKYAGVTPMSSEVLEDARETDLNSVLSERFGRGIAKKEETAFVTATASGREGLAEVSGVTTITSSAVTGSDVSWDDLADLHAAVYAVAEDDTEDSAFYMSMNAYNKLRQSKATGSGEYYLPAVPTMQNPPTAWGKPIVICNRMPQTATAGGEKYIMYTNLRRHAYIGDRRGIRVKILEESTIGSTNLGEQDMLGLRVTKRTAFSTALQSGIGWIVTAT
jgi:HK97 family phage major capsid protein